MSIQSVSLFDSRSQTMKPVAHTDGRVSIYSCGPTVYSPIHIGNARPYVAFALLTRLLSRSGYQPTWVSNITDVNDKIDARAKTEKVDSAVWAVQMTARYKKDTDALNIGRPHHEPKVTQNISVIIALISDLIDKGAAYVLDGDVYFAVEEDSEYGCISHQHLHNLQSQGEEDGEVNKRNPHDFVLWKAAKTHWQENTVWGSPWGRGRPGWHIECSAMAEALFDLPISIHGGGSDLLFPHHENESAQTRQARKKELAEVWMHTGMLQSDDGEKMSKSLGNITPLSDMLNAVGAPAFLLLILGSHYRAPLTITQREITQAISLVEKIRHALSDITGGPAPVEAFAIADQLYTALRDDFNTAQALAHLWQLLSVLREAGSGRELLTEILWLFGLEQLLKEDEPSQEVIQLAQRRLFARQSGEWEKSDALRTQIQEFGWQVKDSKDSYTLIRK